MDNHVSDRFTNTIVDSSVCGRNSDGLLRVKLCTFPICTSPKENYRQSMKFSKNPVVDTIRLMSATSYKPSRVFGFSICYNTKSVSEDLKVLVNELKKNDRHELNSIDKTFLYPSVVDYILNCYGGCIKSRDVTFYPQDLFVLDYSVCEIKNQ